MERRQCKNKVGVTAKLCKKLTNSRDLCFMVHKRDMKDGGDSKTSTWKGWQTVQCNCELPAVLEKAVSGSDVLVYATS